MFNNRRVEGQWLLWDVKGFSVDPLRTYEMAFEGHAPCRGMLPPGEDCQGDIRVDIIGRDDPDHAMVRETKFPGGDGESCKHDIFLATAIGVDQDLVDAMSADNGELNSPNPQRQYFQSPDHTLDVEQGCRNASKSLASRRERKGDNSDEANKPGGMCTRYELGDLEALAMSRLLKV